MKAMNYTEVKKVFKIESKVWACAYEYTSKKESRLNFQKPILGMIMCDKTEERHKEKKERYIQRGYKPPCDYFVPFKQNGKDLAWSKAVKIWSRCYASTEKECKEIFNSLINKKVAWHLEEIEKLKKELI